MSIAPSRIRPRSRCRFALGASLVALLAAALALSACGSKQDALSAGTAKRFTVMLDFFPNADHAALYSALAHGDFSAVGLNVVPETPADPSEPLKLLAAGRVDLAISYEPEVLLARDQGLKVVSIGALVQRPLTSIIALPGKHVASVASLAGKRVGTAGIPYQSAELHTALEHAGVRPSSVREANVGFNLIPAMLSGQVDATLGGFWNYEGIQLRLAHKKPVVIPIDEAGVPTYDELVVVARDEEAQTRRTGPPRIPAGAHAGRARGAREPCGGDGDAAEGRALARTQAPARIDQADTARRAAERSGEALRLAESLSLGDLRKLDVLPQAAPHGPEHRAPPLHQRVPPRAGDLEEIEARPHG